jgi:hypothetical protein
MPDGKAAFERNNAGALIELPEQFQSKEVIGRWIS